VHVDALPQIEFGVTGDSLNPEHDDGYDWTTQSTDYVYTSKAFCAGSTFHAPTMLWSF